MSGKQKAWIDFRRSDYIRTLTTRLDRVSTDEPQAERLCQRVEAALARWAVPTWETRPGRYLTSAEKARMVAEWLAYREGPFPEAPEQRGGMGYPDPEVFDLTDRLNAIDGVCTVGSCSGHKHDFTDPEEIARDTLWCGAVSLRLSEPMMHRFMRDVEQLTRWNLYIDSACVWFGAGGDRVDIQFAGLNGGTQHGSSGESPTQVLSTSSEIIVSFFTSLHAGADA